MDATTHRSKRFLFQAGIWLLIWIAAGLLSVNDIDFVRKNALLFLSQLGVIAILIFYIAPKFLFKKKYFLFVLLSVLVIGILAYVISNPLHPKPPPLHQPFRPMGPKPPPLFLIQFLALSVAYVLATFVETLLFAQLKEKESVRNKNEHLQTELKLLKSQINPHFLFNALNNIYALSVTNSSKTQNSISTLSDMLRYVLYECDRPRVPLKKEVAYIENYLELFALKSSKNYPIEKEFKIMDEKLLIAPMLFVPFVENALKHGDLESNANAFLKIKLASDDKSVEFEIQNSIPENTKVKDSVGGIGLENVRKRLSILYPENFQLQIQDQSEKFVVNLKIQLNETN